MQSLLEARTFHLADCEFRNLSPKTVRAYRWTWDWFLEWCRVHEVPPSLHSLNRLNVQEASVALRAKGRGKRGNQSAASAFVTNMKVISRFLVEEDILEADYLAKLRRPKVPTSARRPLTVWEIQALRGALAQGQQPARDVAAFAVLLDTGMRIGELVGLTLADVDWQVYRLHVWGKGRRERFLPFGSADRGGGKTSRLLRDYLKVRLERDTDALFTSRLGTPMTDQAYRLAFKEAVKVSGLDGEISPHYTRHTYATRYLVRHPGDVEGLRYHLGHLSPEEYRTYAAEAGRIIADVAGRESLYEVLADARPERETTRAEAPGRVTPPAATTPREDRAAPNYARAVPASIRRSTHSRR